MRLTKRSVEGLEAKPGDYITWDCDVKGFGVRVYGTGKRTYVIQYRAGKRTRRLTLGQHGPLTTDEARKLAMQHQLDPLQTRFQLIELGRVVALRLCRHGGVLSEIGLNLDQVRFACI